MAPNDVTDNLGGFRCYANNATAKWLNRPEVQEALHVNLAWQECRLMKKPKDANFN